MKEALTSILLIWGLLFCLSLSNTYGQGRVGIPRDTTGQTKKDSVVYGPNTTQYIYENELKYNRVTYKTVDTLLNGTHNYSRVEQFGNGLQYLGTLGTASTSIFPQPPAVIGATSGFDAFDIYYTSPKDNKFYNTKSPYTQLIITFGGNGRSMVDVTFSRNVTANWNLGANVRTLSIDKQLGSSRSRGDKQVQSYFFDFFTHYRTKNQKYNLMAMVSRLNHEVQESGGVIEDNSSSFPGLSEFYQYENSDVWLGDGELGSASDREFRFHYHLYHQYELNDFLQVYHEFNLYHQHNYFFYEPTGVISNYFLRTLLDSARTSDLTKFKVMENETGFKGKLGALFYNVYFKHRNPRMEYPSDSAIVQRDTFNVKNNEVYGGFKLRLDLGEKTYFSGGAEYLNPNSYRLEAEFINPILKASYVRARALPSYLEQGYSGNHNRWKNNFGSVAYDQIKGSLEYQFGNFYLRPFMTATNVNQPIYFRRDTVFVDVEMPDGTIRKALAPSRQAFPEQASGAAQILSPGFEFHVDFLQKMHLESNVTYSLVSGRAKNAFPIPDWYISSRLYFMNQYIQDKITIQLGADIQYTSAYLGYDYDVATQQFFIQQQMFGNEVLLDNFELFHPEFPAYPIVDFFFVMKVRKARLYVKVPQLNQGIPEDGYFASPFYPGQRRVLDIGINWMFFD